MALGLILLLLLITIGNRSFYEETRQNISTELMPRSVQGSAREWFPGCENFSGKARQKW